MRLLHYSHKPFQLRPCSYLQTFGTANPGKPNGLWVSVEGEADWPSWCESDAPQFLGEYITEITLLPSMKHRVLVIDNLPVFDAFHEQYSHVPDYKKKWPKDIQSKDIDWGRVSAMYAGIIIAPYQWDRRLNRTTNWYYGWDCASGCIWDISVIESCKEAGRAKATIKD